MMTLKKFLVMMVLGCMALYLASFVVQPVNTIQATMDIIHTLFVLIFAFLTGYSLYHIIQHYLKKGDR